MGEIFEGGSEVMTYYEKITESPQLLAEYITDLVAAQWNSNVFCREQYIFDGFIKKVYSTTLIKALTSEINDKNEDTIILQEYIYNRTPNDSSQALKKILELINKGEKDNV